MFTVYKAYTILSTVFYLTPEKVLLSDVVICNLTYLTFNTKHTVGMLVVNVLNF